MRDGTPMTRTKLKLRVRRTQSCVAAALISGLGILLLTGPGLEQASASDTSGPKPPSVPEAPIDVTGRSAEVELGDRVRAGLAASPAAPVFAGLAWDWDSNTIHVRVTAAEKDVTPAQLSALKDAERVAGRFPVQVEYGARSETAMRAFARKLIDDPDSWAPGLPGRPGGGFDYKSQKVVLTVMETDDPERWQSAVTALGDDAVEMRVIAVPPDGALAAEASRISDTPYWTGGSKLTLTGGVCTAGFNWKTWSGGQTVGSTARHCAATYFYNAGNLWGTSLVSSPNADARLLSSSSQYAPNVWVGSTSTSDFRPVVAVDTSWNVDDPVALSGASTGLTTALVADPDYTLPSAAGCGGGLRGVLMDRHNSAGGDSGGPWLTTQSGTGWVVAHGQHFGYDVCDTQGSFFMRLTTISSRLSASIYLDTSP